MTKRKNLELLIEDYNKEFGDRLQLMEHAPKCFSIVRKQLPDNPFPLEVGLTIQEAFRWFTGYLYALNNPVARF